MSGSFLSLPEHQRVYQLLCDHPTGSIRSWATLANWTPARLQRFLETLKCQRLCEVESVGNHGSLFIPLAVSPRIAAYRAVSEVSRKAVNNKLPRYAEATEKLDVAEAKSLIALANHILAKKVGEYKPIYPDNQGSHRAVKQWLELGTVEDLEKVLTELCAEFNPSKVGGQVPVSLAFFNKRIPTNLKRIQRERKAAMEREQLPLLPEIKVERGGLPAEKPSTEIHDRTARITETDWRKLVARPESA